VLTFTADCIKLSNNYFQFLIIHGNADNRKEMDNEAKRDVKRQ